MTDQNNTTAAGTAGLTGVGVSGSADAAANGITASTVIDATPDTTTDTTSNVTTLSDTDLDRVLYATPDTAPDVATLSDTDLDRVLDAWSADVDKAKHADGYTPVFPDTVRTIIYVIALIASVIGLGLMSFGHADIGGFVSTAAGIIAGGFGVAYNPLRQN